MKRLELRPDKSIKPDILKSEKAKVSEVAIAVRRSADVLADGEPRSMYDEKLACQ